MNKLTAFQVGLIGLDKEALISGVDGDVAKEEKDKEAFLGPLLPAAGLGLGVAASVPFNVARGALAYKLSGKKGQSALQSIISKIKSMAVKQAPGETTIG